MLTLGSLLLASRRLKVGHCYSFRVGWVGWGQRVSICSIAILRRRKLFYNRGEPWSPFYLRTTFLHCVGHSFIRHSVQSLGFHQAISYPRKHLNNPSKQLPDLRSPGCRFGVFLVLPLRSHVFFFFFLLPVFVCKINSICYYRKSYTKHYIVTFWILRGTISQ